MISIRNEIRRETLFERFSHVRISFNVAAANVTIVRDGEYDGGDGGGGCFKLIADYTA